MSLDGYIADRQGGVSWLVGEDADADMPDSYGLFVQNVDTVIMGWNTYHQIVTELSPDKWVYNGLKSYVVTHRSELQKDDVCFTSESPEELVTRLRQEEGKDIWVCGGADIVRQLLQSGLIDMFHISIIPMLLGDGIRLFDTLENPDVVSLQLIGAQHYNGISELVYKRKNKSDIK